MPGRRSPARARPCSPNRRTHATPRVPNLGGMGFAHHPATGRWGDTEKPANYVTEGNRAKGERICRVETDRVDMSWRRWRLRPGSRTPRPLAPRACPRKRFATGSTTTRSGRGWLLAPRVRRPRRVPVLVVRHRPQPGDLAGSFGRYPCPYSFSAVGRYGPRLDDGLGVYFSGGKGFHILVELVTAWVPDANVPATCKRLALVLAAKAGIRIDTGCYDHQRLVRLPNSRHTSTGLHKRFLTHDELFELTLSRIQELARAPAAFPVPMCGTSDTLLDDWDAAKLEIVSRPPATPTNAFPVVPKFVRDFIAFEDVLDPGRAITLFRCAAALAEAGTPPTVVFGLLEEPARHEDRAGTGRGATPDRQRHRTRTQERWVRMSAAKYITAADVALSAAFDPDAPAPPRYNPGSAFEALDIRPGRVVLIGAPPGAGKTALVLQLAAGVLQHHSEVRARRRQRGNDTGRSAREDRRSVRRLARHGGR